MKTLLLLALVAVLLFMTNPDRAKFEVFVRDTINEQVAGRVGAGVLGGMAGDVAGRAVERVARGATRKNYYLFSTYTADIPDLPGVRIEGVSGRWKFLGIGTQFIPLERPDALKTKD